MTPTNFPSPSAQILSTLIHFLGTTVLTHCLSRRFASECFSSWRNFRNIPFARALVLSVFIDSWLFVFASTIVTFGIGMARNLTACSSANYICTFFYATSKSLIYLFLVEKMHLVWEPLGARSRFKSPLYVLCSLSMLGYVTLFILLLIARTDPVYDVNGLCTVGVKVYVSMCILAFDLYVNVLLTALFVIPLWRRTCRSNSILRRATIRTLIAAVISLTVSTANMLALSLMGGQQPGWICLGSCTLDIVINALALFWVTSCSSRDSGTPDTALLPTYKTQTPSDLFRRTELTDTRLMTTQDADGQIFVAVSVETNDFARDVDKDKDGNRSVLLDKRYSVSAVGSVV